MQCKYSRFILCALNRDKLELDGRSLKEASLLNKEENIIKPIGVSLLQFTLEKGKN